MSILGWQSGGASAFLHHDMTGHFPNQWGADWHLLAFGRIAPAPCMCSRWQQSDAGSNQPFWSFSGRANAEDCWPREFVNVYDIHVGVMSGFPLTLLIIAGRVLSQQTKQPSQLSTLQLQPSIMRQLAMAWRVRLEFWCTVGPQQCESSDFKHLQSQHWARTGPAGCCSCVPRHVRNGAAPSRAAIDQLCTHPEADWTTSRPLRSSVSFGPAIQRKLYVQMPSPSSPSPSNLNGLTSSKRNHAFLPVPSNIWWCSHISTKPLEFCGAWWLISPCSKTTVLLECKVDIPF